MTRALDELTRLLAGVGREGQDLGRVQLRGADPVLATRFRVGEAAAVALAGCGVLAGECHRRFNREGNASGDGAQAVSVDVAAAAASLLGFVFQRVEDGPSPQYTDRENITDFYTTADDRWVLVHGGFAHLQQGMLDLLGVDSREPAPKLEVASAIAEWNALELEEAIAKRGLCGAMVRSEREWRAHPQGQAIDKLGVVEVIRLGDSPPEAFRLGSRAGDRPLSGVRVLDLTRVLAGPTCARTLAAHGAEVLKISAPHLANVPLFVMDTGHGKRSAYLDLRDPSDLETLRDLAAGADVFSQGYRLGALETLGLDPASLHALRPGIVYTSIDCYGHEGPWRDRRGWEQLAQTVTGIAEENGRQENGGEGERPALLPAAATDYTTGYLAAFGTLAALLRRAEEGGSYHVRVSLAQTGMWIQGMDRCEARGSGLSAESLAPWMTVSDTPYGRLHHLGPVVEMPDTPARWVLPTVPLGTHPAAWR